MLYLMVSEDSLAGRAARKAYLTPEPQRQNAAEKTVERLLDGLRMVFEAMKQEFRFRKLPSKGRSAIVLADGAFQPLGRRKAAASKTMDYEIMFCGRRFYMPAKYTSGGGGSQDNARRELESLIANAGDLAGEHDLLILADGDHYGLPGEGGRTHLENLRAAAAATKRVTVLTHKDLHGFFFGLQ